MHKCVGIVLAGGLSNRMGSDKALLVRQQQKMLDFSQQLLRETGVDDVMVSGDKYGIADLYPQAGPLSGICSVIKQTPCSSVLVLPIDLPLITSSALKELKNIGQLTEKACFYQNHAIPMYLPINSLTELFFEQAFKHFNGKGPSVRSMLKQVPHQAIPIEDERLLLNTNTPQEWQHAQQILASSFKQPMQHL
ncbi:molybdenum cofactor guanylyltransferase [Thalassotalea atypica]|uniref:molybdenum cofactor guanylyltransferase n=1 Tax=Thalassotalea atypica TaxID=2054316 RepID=UPI0025745E31|nr:molybdenum cofactor guanylyltransferase [Thalassotalea atypica]